ncbi:MAG: glycosyltransferase family 9 protein, partial [Candidatus Omnitrophica bacterium]|nr:glycosyltransferase family 9 protein [Candidatus Omnitrophota bacterium]
NFLLILFRFLFFWRKSIPKNIKKIIILRVGNIGDIICAVPAMEAIRKNFPEAEITLLSSPGKYGAVGAKELLKNTIFLDKLKIYYHEDINTLKDKISLIRKLKKENYDLFIEFPKNLADFGTEMRNMIFAKIIGCQYALGFKVSTIKMFAKIQSKYISFDNEVERLLKIIQKESLKISDVLFPLPISAEDKKIVNNFLFKLDNEKLIALNPNAKRQTNRWPLKRFGEVGRWLVNHYNARVFIIGGNADRKRMAELKKMIGVGAVDLAGKFSLLQTIELLKHCQFLVSNDSGAIHMASAVNTPVVGIYSARDLKNKWYPYGERNVIFRKSPKCQVCFKEECNNLACLNKVKTDEVCEAINKLFINRNMKQNYPKERDNLEYYKENIK